MLTVTVRLKIGFLFAMCVPTYIASAYMVLVTSSFRLLLLEPTMNPLQGHSMTVIARNSFIPGCEVSIYSYVQFAQ